MSHSGTFFVGLFFGAVVSGVLFFCVGGQYSESAWMKFAVYHNAGHYDAKTGGFVWNDDTTTIMQR